MSGALSEGCALAALLVTLAFAVARPHRLPEAVVAIPLAGLLVVTGVEPWTHASHAMRSLLPTVAFLALILTFGHLCAAIGIFDYLGARAARASGGRPRRLLLLVVVLAAAVTATLTLDATVVLVTPVVLRTAARLRTEPRPHLYACTELANSGSLLLPVSNLTNLLAFSATGLSFARFAEYMALPWVAAVALEWGALRFYFRDDLAGPPHEPAPAPPAPRYGLTVLALTIVGFVVTSGIGIAPAWAALAGVVLLSVVLLPRRATTPAQVLGAASPGFVGFVLALAVIVDAVNRHGAGRALARLVPSGTSLITLLALAFLAAAVANLANNLPATLALVPLVAGHPAAVLAVLLGVNIGPNATYAGSLATLLWRRLLPGEHRPRAGEFHRFGLLSVPVVLAATTVALWLTVSITSR